MKISRGFLIAVFCFITIPQWSLANESVARKWNEALLQAIRKDFARPTVHARNLFHTSVVMYDAWAVYDTVATTYFLGKTVNGFTCPFNGIDLPSDIQAAREEAISYAAYRLLSHRFKNSPNAAKTLRMMDSVMADLGYDKDNITLDYTSGPAGLGNYLAQFMINFGLQDGSNELKFYENQFYKPVNPNLIMAFPGNPKMKDPNRWQPLTLKVFIDQSGNVIPLKTPPFLSPEWGTVAPFAFKTEDLTIHTRDSNDYWVYLDPGGPPKLDTNAVGGLSEEYKWGFEMVSMWSSQLDPADTTRWDISPASIGNVQNYPQTITDLPGFYNELAGGDPGKGYTVNPSTGKPYTPQIVKRADYARVLAEFWADGPDSETPPGHWFSLLNYVSDHPMVEKKFRGTGPILPDLEWDVKSYFIMGGVVHDAAVSSWGIKGWYDFVRPVSAIRFMAELGQSSDTSLPRYHPGGMRLKPGYIELVKPGDTLAGPTNQHVDKIKLYAWKGPDYISNPNIDIAGVDWILAENWWPYQRPSFVTPPFAGYISGHSTYSRAAAEAITLLTGDAYFPGGMGEFFAQKNKFLVFEEGPSEDITLQWATYRDASDQCSLSRIWGGIHPPADDIPGRLIGEKIGIEGFTLAETYFTRDYTGLDNINDCASSVSYFPNPVIDNLNIEISCPKSDVIIQVFDTYGRLILKEKAYMNNNEQIMSLAMNGLQPGVYVIKLSNQSWSASQRILKL